MRNCRRPRKKKELKSEAANRISPRVTRASKCVLAYEKVTRYMSTLGYRVHGTIHKQVTFPLSSMRLQREPERNRKNQPICPSSTAIPRDPPYPFTTVGPRSLGRQTATSSGVTAGGILQMLFGSPVQRPMPNQRCQTIIAHLLMN